VGNAQLLPTRQTGASRGLFESGDLGAINSFGSIKINDNLESCQDLSMESKSYLGQNPFIGPSSVVLRVMRFEGHKLIWKHSN